MQPYEKQYEVNNLETDYKDFRYTVIKDHTQDISPTYRGYWYWAGYNDLTEAARETMQDSLCILIETSQIVPGPFNTYLNKQ